MAVNVTSSTRDITELNPLVQVMLNAALDKIKAKKINPLVVETYRPKELETMFNSRLQGGEYLNG